MATSMFAVPEIPGYPFLARRRNRAGQIDETSSFWVTGPGRGKGSRYSLNTADPREAIRRYDLKRGKPVSIDRRKTVDEEWNVWIEKVDLAASARKRYRGVYGKWAQDKLGARAIADDGIRALVQECLNRIEENGLSTSSINNLRTALGSFFRDMVLKGYRDDIPVPPRPRKRRGKAMPNQRPMEITQIVTPYEQEALKEGAQRLWAGRSGLYERRLAQMDLFLTLLPRTGLRLSEALGLRTEDIKTPEGKTAYIDLQQQLSSEYRADDDRERWFEALKTGERIGDRARKVPLDSFALLAIQRYQRLAISKGWMHLSGGLFFTTANGTPVSQSNWGNYFRQVLAASSVNRRVIPHYFRHTAVSMLIKNGLKLEKVANVIGDRPETVTAVYAHIQEDEDFLAEVVEAMAS